MNKESIVLEYPKNNREIIRIGRSEFKSQDLMFIRTYFADHNNDLIATKKGISLHVKKFKELLVGIRALEEVLGTEELVARIAKNSSEEIRIRSTNYQGQGRIDIRTYTNYFKEYEYTPTRKGISFNTSLYPLLLEGIVKLGEEVTKKHSKIPANVCQPTKKFFIDENGFLITEEGLKDRRSDFGLPYAS